MSYNKAKEEKKWRKWKEQEEEKLRELGMDEDNIKLLHDYDQEAFNADRLYQTRQYVNSNLAETGVTTIELPINSLDDLLSLLDNEELFKAMKKINHKLTMQIIHLRICGYTAKEIALKLDMNVDSVYYFIKSARKKLKNLK
ncbi:MAG: sigma-70 family RNA polymerase sigma factor [Erysipelotrichaceae bacterium]|nr:sigma-70 family RNA polymerase sigma factor [Erysipelotrichaceae bacterium]